MNEILLKIGIALMGVFLGNFIPRFLDRAKPFLVIEKFYTATKNTGDSTCTEDVSKLTRESWYMDFIEPGECFWVELEYAYRMSRREVDDLKGIKEKADKLKRIMENSTDLISKKNALSKLFEEENLELLEIFRQMLFRRLAILSGETYEGKDALLQVIQSDEKGGCYYILFDHTLERLGRGLNHNEWLHNSLLSLVKAIRYLDLNLIISNLDLISKYGEEQRNIHLEIKELLHPLQQKKTIWIAECSLINYGKAPMIIFPEAELQIFRNWINKEASIKCHIAIPKQGKEDKEDEKGDATDLKGPMILTPNERKKILIATKENRDEMKNGSAIEGYFSDANSKARVILKTSHRAIPFLNRIYSTKLVFAEPE